MVNIKKRSVRFILLLSIILSNIGYFMSINDEATEPKTVKVFYETVYAEEAKDNSSMVCEIENVRREHSGEEKLDCDNLELVDLSTLEFKEKTDLVEVDKKPEFVWTGPVLTQRKGVNFGPTGRETYYNLPMGGVIKIMRSIGNTDNYWVREDGVKMLGEYIMVAANLNVFPRGTIVPTSLGMGIVCDTGDFAKKNPRQLDIAVAWR